MFYELTPATLYFSIIYQINYFSQISARKLKIHRNTMINTRVSYSKVVFDTKIR